MDLSRTQHIELIVCENNTVMNFIKGMFFVLSTLIYHRNHFSTDFVLRTLKWLLIKGNFTLVKAEGFSKALTVYKIDFRIQSDACSYPLEEHLSVTTERSWLQKYLRR